MRVLVKRTIVDKLVAQLDAVRDDNRAPDCCLVTPEEYKELMADGRHHYFVPDWMQTSPSDDTFTVTHRRFRIRVTSYRENDSFAAIERGTFMGVKVYIIPANLIDRIIQE